MSIRVPAALLFVLATTALPGCVWEAWQNDGQGGGASSPGDSPNSGSTPGFEEPSPASADWDAFMTSAPGAAPRYLDTLEGLWAGSAIEGVDLRVEFRSGTITIGVQCGSRSGGLDVSAQIREGGFEQEVVFPSSAKTTVYSAISKEGQDVCEIGVTAGGTSLYPSNGTLTASFLEGQIGRTSPGGYSPSYRAMTGSTRLTKISD